MEAFARSDLLKDRSDRPVRGRTATGLHHPLSAARFEDHLLHERLRAERSGRTIALLQIDCRMCFKREKQQEGSARILEYLCENTRLTDLIGWHKDGEVIGVIITEFGKCTPLQAIDCLRAKIIPILSHPFCLAHTRVPRLTVQFFPEDATSGEEVVKLDLTFYPELQTERARTRAKVAVKRIVDIIGSSAALVLLLPVFAVIAVAVRISSRGPALYRQQRVGQFGVDFTMLKFRTMHQNAETAAHEEYVRGFIGGQSAPINGEGLYKLTNDPRVTRLGKFLRRTSLDELPQFLNVLEGSMSLVGPRPPLRYELTFYQPWHRRRLLESKPGVTGLWQVSGRSRTRFEEMVRLDLRYTKEKSTLLDFAILMKTVRSLIADNDAC